MQSPSDEGVSRLAEDLLSAFRGVFGKHPGFRPGKTLSHEKAYETHKELTSLWFTAHAKGELVAGTFTPSAEAAQLSKAPHFQASSTPIWVRFSNSTGLPNVPDNSPSANPNGMAIRFHLPEKNGRRVHTDIVGHSVPLFPTRTGGEFLEFLRAVAASSSPDAQASPVEQFVSSHPATKAFVTYPKPSPASYATQQYYSVSAYKLVDAAGKGTYVRYHVVPEAGVETLDQAEVEAKGENYLQEELPIRLGKGPVAFKLLVQVAEHGDITDDATVQWPQSRKVVELGRLKIDALLPDNTKEQKRVIFDPIPRVEGVEPSDDPLLELRAALYLLSGRERRAA
jgi:catalase